MYFSSTVTTVGKLSFKYYLLFSELQNSKIKDLHILFSRIQDDIFMCIRCSNTEKT